MLYPASNRTASAEYFVSLQGRGGDAVASLTDNIMPLGYNAADGKIGGDERVITSWMKL